MEQFCLTMINTLPSAYIDPASGTMLLQIIISVMIGTTIFFRALIARVIGWIKNRLLRK